MDNKSKHHTNNLSLSLHTNNLCLSLTHTHTLSLSLSLSTPTISLTLSLMDHNQNQKAELPISSGPESNERNERDHGFPHVTFFATSFLTFSTVVAVIRAHHDILAVAFILSINVSVTLLILCIHVYDRLPEGLERERLKIPIWILLTVLQVVFAYRVSIILPLACDLLVWILVGSTSLIGFYFFFIYPIIASHKKRSGANQSSPVEEV